MLFDTYARLVREFPDSCEHLFGSEISADGLWLSVDDQLHPSLLFPADAADERSDITLRFIDVEFSRSCEIARSGAEPVSGVYTIVRLNEDDPEISRVFLRLLEEAFCQNGGGPLRNREIGDRMLEIADLFSRIEAVQGDIVGLWGELHVILQAANVPAAARFWCLHKNARYDFVAPHFVLEVKTTLRGSRQHRFSLEQLRPQSELEVYVASLQLVETHAGANVSALLEAIYERIDDSDLRRAFFNQCLVKGGRDVYRSDLRLQLLSAENALALFRAEDIPVPRAEPSDQITSIRFDVDLSQVPESDDEQRNQLLSFGDKNVLRCRSR